MEPVSINETYFDATENKVNYKSTTKIARMIQADIWERVQLACSTRVSYNKFLAKLASDYQKPRGATVAAPQDVVPFLKTLPIEKFHGVRRETIPKIYELRIRTGKDLYEYAKMTLIRNFGRMGYSLYRRVRGIHDSPVNVTRERRSMGKEHTYGQPLQTGETVLTQLHQLAEKVEGALRRVQKHGKTVVLEVRYTSCFTVTKRVTLLEYTYRKEALFYQASPIWEKILGIGKGTRLLGITLTNLDPVAYENIALPLWGNQEI